MNTDSEDIFSTLESVQSLGLLLAEAFSLVRLVQLQRAEVLTGRCIVFRYSVNGLTSSGL